MKPADVIATKRDGGEWTSDELQWFLTGYLTGEIADYQMAAWLMAVCLRGMSERETADLTRIMAESGDQVDLSGLGSLSADKHSSGGVGDKTSLIVGPLAAACGVKVAKMSGRGLAHTGGTIDKLESIPGFQTDLSLERFMAQVKRVGLVIAGQTANLAPADKKLYALRDVTGTVPSIPLIASSIMSKKIAAGAKNIVLDVKMGAGAFMRTPEDAAILSKAMTGIGRQLNRRVVAVTTDMNEPLGMAIGNALEVKEAIDTLRGQGPKDLLAVSVALAAEMVRLAHDISLDEAVRRVRQAYHSGQAWQVCMDWIEAQGGETTPTGPSLPETAQKIPVPAPQTGVVAAINALTIGQGAMDLGAGRAYLGAPIDQKVGIVLARRRGDHVQKGDPIAFLHVSHLDHVERVQGLIQSAFTFSDQPVAPLPLFYGRVDEDGNETDLQSWLAAFA
ncbi:MAG: thymidine phosphorylase [Firmicutes bacterium]|nr:thymidine phosphorylase [Bacillota bacterium]